MMGRFKKNCYLFQRLGLCILVLPLLASCGGNVAKETYNLGVSDVQLLRSTQQKDIQIMVSFPTAVKALDGQDIAIKGGQQSVAYLQNAQWSDRLPNLVQERLIQLFENSDRFGGVGRPGEGLAINYQIMTNLRSFDITLLNDEYDIASVEIGVRIVDDRNGNVHATRVFKAQKLFNHADDWMYIAALNDAFKIVSKQIVEWTVSKI